MPASLGLCSELPITLGQLFGGRVSCVLTGPRTRPQVQVSLAPPRHRQGIAEGFLYDATTNGLGNINASQYPSHLGA